MTHKDSAQLARFPTKASKYEKNVVKKISHLQYSQDIIMWLHYIGLTTPNVEYNTVGT